jgi:hypothetical protein
MNKGAFAKKIHEQDVDLFKKWLWDTTPITVRQGLEDILSTSIPFYALRELQLRHAANKLLNVPGFEDGDIILDVGSMLPIPDFNSQGILRAVIGSRLKFVKLIYQSISCFPTALLDAYTEITGETLILDDLSEVREFYEHCSQIDLWTAQEFCAYISHCSPSSLDFISEYPELDFMSEDPEVQQAIVEDLGDLLPGTLSRFLLRPDLYEYNLAFLKAAVLGGAFEITLLDPDNWERSSLKPQKGLEWAKKRGLSTTLCLTSFSSI